LSPEYAADLRARSGRKGATREGAFVERARSRDALAEQLGEAFVETATSGDDAGRDGPAFPSSEQAFPDTNDAIELGDLLPITLR
jgi:hypothetical protein